MKKYFYFLFYFMLMMKLLEANSLPLRLNPASFDDQLLTKDPFEKAEFVKSVQMRGSTRVNSSYRILNDINNAKVKNFNLSQMSIIRLRGRVSRVVNFGFNLSFRSNFLGEQDNYEDAEDQRYFGTVNVGVNGGGINVFERFPFGLLTFGLDLGIRYYAGLLTFSGQNANLRNSNFRTAPNLISPSSGFSTYERQFNATGMSAQPDVIINGIVNPFRAQGFKLLLQDLGGTGINAFSFVGITRVNTNVLRRQLNSTTFFNRMYKVFGVNLFGKRAKYELGLNTQLITGSSNTGANQAINYYIHSATLGKRTNAIGRGLSSEPFQPEYEIAFMRSVIPYVSNQSIKHKSVAKGIILKHGISGSIFGVNPLLLRLNMYHVDSGYVNPHGGFYITTPLSFMYSENGISTALTTTPNNDRILPIDGVANNRQGINFQYGYDFYNIFAHDALRVTASHEVSRQLSRSISPLISNPNGTGITRTDAQSSVLHFSSFEVDVKYLGKVKDKKIYFQTFLLNYTTKPSFHWVPDMSNESFVRSIRVSSSVFYHIAKGVVPFVSFDYRRVRGNINTRLFIVSGEPSAILFSPTDVITKTITTGVNLHLNRDYLLSLRLSHRSGKNLANINRFFDASAINFNIVYNFRAT